MKRSCVLVTMLLGCVMGMRSGASGQVTAAHEQPAAKPGVQASKINLDAKAMRMRDFVEALSEQSGNRTLAIAEPIDQQTVTIRLVDTPYWEALDRVCEPLGIMVDGNWPRENLVLGESRRDGKLTGYSGAVVVKVDSVTETLLFRMMRLRNPREAGPEGLTCGFTYYWEDRLEPILTEMRLTRAVTPEGKSVLAENAPKCKPLANLARNEGEQASPPCRAVTCTLEHPPEGTKKLSEIAGVVRLEFGTGKKELKIDDVLKSTGKEIKQDDWTIRVKNVDNTKGSLLVEVETTYRGETTSLPESWHQGDYGWYLARGGDDGEGERVRGGIMNRRGGLWVAGEGNGDAAAVQKGDHLVFFPGEHKNGVYRLVLALPATFESKEFPFVIKDVPVP